MHRLQNAVAAALHRQMRALAKLGQAAIGFDQIIAVAFGMRRGETNALQSLQLMHRFEKLHKGRSALAKWNVALAVTGHNLAEQSDFLRAVLRQLAAFLEDVGNGPAALFATRKGYNAKCAVLVAALHDADEGGDWRNGLLRQRQVLFDGRLAAGFGPHLDNFFTFALENFVEVLGGAMKFLGADDETHFRQLIEQLLSATLRHATHEAQHDGRAMLADFGGDVLHFADGLLFGHVAHAASVEKNDICGGFGWGQSVAFGGQLGGDGFRVALVHLATVSFDVNTGHDCNAHPQGGSTLPLFWPTGIARRVCAGFRPGFFCAGGGSSASPPRIRPARCIPRRVRETFSMADRVEFLCHRLANAYWSGVWLCRD